jgi:hypothetical protein
MLNSYLDLLKSTSVDNINFLKDVNKAIRFDTNAKWKFIYIPFANSKVLWNFISNLDPNALYTIIPMISIDGKEIKPHLILSQQFLMTQYSNPTIIHNFILQQMHEAFNDFDFDLKDGKYFYLILKYKEIKLI